MSNVQNDNQTLNRSHYIGQFTNPTIQIREYTTPGSYSVQIPADVTSLIVTGCGAGGSGGKGGPGGTPYTPGSFVVTIGGGGGGGAGANLASIVKEVTPLATYGVTVGVGAVNANGGNSIFANLTFKGGEKGDNAGTNYNQHGGNFIANGGDDGAGFINDTIGGGKSEQTGLESPYGTGGAPGVGYAPSNGGKGGQPGGKCAGGGGGYRGRDYYYGGTPTGQNGFNATEIGAGGGGGGGGGWGYGALGGNGGSGGPGYIALIYVSKFTIP